MPTNERLADFFPPFPLPAALENARAKGKSTPYVRRMKQNVNEKSSFSRRFCGGLAVCFLVKILYCRIQSCLLLWLVDDMEGRESFYLQECVGGSWEGNILNYPAPSPASSRGEGVERSIFRFSA